MNILDTWQRLDAHRWKLVQQTDIPDMAYYSRQWAALALGYRIVDFPASAETCEKNATRYGAMAGKWRKVPTNSVTWLEYAGGV